MLRRIVSVVQVVALGCILVFVVLLFANEPDDGTAAQPAANAVGARVYAANCARCHGADGNGGLGPKLSGGAVVKIYPDPADQVAVVTAGRGGMPSFGGVLSAEEITAVVQYTRSLP